MTKPRRLPLCDLQPSQLVVSRDKRAAVHDAWPDREASSLGPLPVKRYADRLVLTDGHTRALAAKRASEPQDP